MLSVRRSPRTPAQRIGFALTAMAALVLGYFWGNDFSRQQLQKQISAGLISEAPALPEFQLLDQQGAPFSQADLKGHWSFLYPGCLTCPQNQAAVLLLFVQVHNRLADRPRLQANTRFLFLATDPAETTAEAFRSPFAFLPTAFVGLRGAAEPLIEWLRPWGPGETEPGARMDGRSPLFLIGPETRLIARYSGWSEAEGIAADLKTLADRFGD